MKTSNQKLIFSRSLSILLSNMIYSQNTYPDVSVSDSILMWHGTHSTSACTGLIYGEGGPDGSPFSDTYSSATIFDWGGNITLEVLYFDLPINFETSISIYDGADTNAELLGDFGFGGLEDSIFISSGNAITIVFETPFWTLESVLL